MQNLAGSLGFVSVKEGPRVSFVGDLIKAKSLGEAAARFDCDPDRTFRGAFAAAADHGYDRGSAAHNCFIAAYLRTLTNFDDLPSKQKTQTLGSRRAVRRSG